MKHSLCSFLPSPQPLTTMSLPSVSTDSPILDLSWYHMWPLNLSSFTPHNVFKAHYGIAQRSTLLLVTKSSGSVIPRAQDSSDRGPATRLFIAIHSQGEQTWKAGTCFPESSPKESQDTFNSPATSSDNWCEMLPTWEAHE
jgi:hypothetical protein